MLPSLSAARLPALPAVVVVSVAAVVLGAGWNVEAERSMSQPAQAEAPKARPLTGALATTTRFTPFDLAAVSLRDFGDVDRK